MRKLVSAAALGLVVTLGACSPAAEAPAPAPAAEPAAPAAEPAAPAAEPAPPPAAAPKRSAAELEKKWKESVVPFEPDEQAASAAEPEPADHASAILERAEEEATEVSACIQACLGSVGGARALLTHG